MTRLRAWYPYAHRDRLVWSYAEERDPGRKHDSPERSAI